MQKKNKFVKMTEAIALQNNCFNFKFKKQIALLLCATTLMRRFFIFIFIIFLIVCQQNSRWSCYR